MTPFEQAKAERAKLDAECEAASLALQKFPKTGPMGLTPDHVKASSEFRTANARFQKAFAALRAFNVEYVKRFKKEIRADRDARNAARLAARSDT